MKTSTLYFALGVCLGIAAVYVYKVKCGGGMCPSGSSKNPVEQINAQNLKQEMTSNQNLVVVNVLSKQAYDDCRIAGSISMPYQDLESSAATLDSSKEYVVYCSSYQCSASKEAYKILKAKGFKVRAYEGGIKEWREMGFETEGPCSMAK